jgi:hypothetical protein
MALNDKLGKLVDVILSRTVVAGVKTADGEGGGGGGGGSPAQSANVEDQGEIVNLERKPGDFDKKEEKFHDKLKEDLYILMEGDARFGYENQPIDILISKARTVIKCCVEKEKLNKQGKKVYPKLPSLRLKKKKDGTSNRSTE